LQVAGKYLSKFKVFVLSTEPLTSLQFGIHYPSRFAITNKDQVVILSQGCYIYFIKPNGDQLRYFGSSGSNPGQLSGASRIALTSSGNILVCDSSNNRVQQFSFAGQLVKCVGSRGSAPLQFSNPVGIAVHPLSQKVYVVEQINHRIQILNSDLTFVSMFGSRGTENGQFINPCDVAFNSCGDVFVLDRDNLRIQVFTSGGEYVWQFTMRDHNQGNPQTIAIDSGDRVYVTEQDIHSISIFSPDGHLVMSFGKQGMKAGQFTGPLGVDFDKAGCMYIMDKLSLEGYDSIRIQVF
jgi:tripartite motif-containing protein 2/3/tripartite motif-containing protein 71